MSKNYTGIEIGTTQVKLAMVAGGCVKKLAVGEVPTNLVKDGAVISLESMSEVIRQTAKENHITQRNCAVVMPSSLVYSRTVTIPYMTADQLVLNLPYEFRDYISQEKDKYFYDYAVLGEERDEAGVITSYDLMAAACLKASIRDYGDMLRRAGFSMKVAIPQESALRNLLIARGFDDGVTRCFIDLGHSSTKLYIYTGARFDASRAFDYGGSSINDAIAEAMNVDEHLADTYKKTNYENVQEHDLARTVYERISTEIMRAMKFFSFSNRGKSVDEIFFCGGGHELGSLTDAITRELDIVPSPVSKLIPDDSKDETLFPLCIAAVGAALQ